MKRTISLILAGIMISSGLIAMVGMGSIEPGGIEPKGSGSDLIISNSYTVSGLETWDDVLVTGTGKLIVPAGAIFNVTNIYLQGTSIVEVAGGNINLSSLNPAVDVMFNGTCSYFNVTDNSNISMIGPDGYADTSSPGPYTAYIPTSKGGNAELNITATEGLRVENSILYLIGGDGFDLPSSTATACNAWSNGGDLGGHIAAGGDVTIAMNLTKVDGSLTIDNSTLNITGGNGGKAAKGGDRVVNPGIGGGYSNGGEVFDRVGVGGNANLLTSSIQEIQIANSKMILLSGNGGDAGDGGNGAGSGGGGGGYGGGTAGASVVEVGSDSGDVYGSVGSGGNGFAKLSSDKLYLLNVNITNLGGDGGDAGDGGGSAGTGPGGGAGYGGGGGGNKNGGNAYVSGKVAMGGAVETSIFGDLIDINNISILHRGGNGGDGGDGGSPSDSVGGGGGGYGGGGAAGGWAPRDPGDTIVSDEVGAGGDSIVEVNATGSLFLFGRSNINSTGGSGGNGGIGGLEGGTGGGGGGGGYGGGGGGQDISGGGLNTLSGSIGHGGNSTVSLISPKPTISRKAEFFNYNGTGGIAPDSPGGGLGGGKGLGYITSKGIATTYVPMSIPLLLSPVNNSIHPITPTFEWLELHNSTINDPLSNYTIEFDDSNDFLSPALVNKTMMGNCTPTPPLPDGIYYWRVMANYSTPPTSTAGWSDVRVVTIGFDKTPPVISSVLVSNIGDASATITWTTDEPSDSTVNYSINSDLTSNSTVYDATMTTSHSVALTGLTPSTTYYFEVSSSDELNNTATDNNGLAYYSFTTTGDNSPPVSSVNSIDPYWHTTSTLDITASAYDSGNDVSNVTLWYSYSSDNALWGMNKSYAIDTTEPWGWVFDFPDGEGYYKFYSIANDTVDNTEDAPATADSSCAYDFTLPVITNNCPISGTTGDPYTFMAEAIDNFEIDEVWVVYEFGTGAVTNDTMIQSMADDYEVVIDVPLNSTDPIHYRILATDIAGISNSSYLGLVSILDNDAPVAHASHNPAVVEGTIVTLDGSDSVDNIGIDEYTWSFKDGAQDVTLHGAVSSYNFTISGNYTVTLNVQDAAGNNDIDTMTVTVEEILIDTDGDGIPDEDDDFPLDPSEDTDTDGDDIGNNADLDDDGDGYLDEWENFLGSDPLDQNDKPADADGDGIPDGDADNTESWMDTDDDGDGILDPDDIAPLDPPVTGNGGLAEYWWIILIIIIVLIVVVLIWYKNKGKKMSEAPVEETPVEEAFEDGEVLPPPYSPES